MSSGVSNQMKLAENSVKNVEDRSIPWSQQVDEAASFENLVSSNDNNFKVTNQNSVAQFQYPPFNAKDNQNYWGNNRSRQFAANLDFNKKYTSKPAFYNNSKKDDYQHNVRKPSNVRRLTSDSSTGSYNRSDRNNSWYDGHCFENFEDKLGENIISDEKKSNVLFTVPKKTTWASIASQPAKLTSRCTTSKASHKKKGPGMPPPPMVPGKHNLDVNTWDLPNNNITLVPSPPLPENLDFTENNYDFSIGVAKAVQSGKGELQTKCSDLNKEDDNTLKYNFNFGRIRNSSSSHPRKTWSTQPNRQTDEDNFRRKGVEIEDGANNENMFSSTARLKEEQINTNKSIEKNDYSDSYDYNTAYTEEEKPLELPHAVLDELRDKNNYNPLKIDLEKASVARFFVIKSYSEDDIHRSIKYEIWCSTDHGNKRLDDAFKERQNGAGNILLFFSVNGSGHFCGMAQMMTPVDYNSTSSVWSQDKWKGKFKVKWIYVKDVPNNKLRHITLENNENKPVTNSRDTQEVPKSKGIEVLQIIHTYKHTTSIFDDFYHYEKKQEEEVYKKPFGNNDGVSSVNGRQLNIKSSANHERNDSRDLPKKDPNSSFRERRTYRGTYNAIPNENRRGDTSRSKERGDFTNFTFERENNVFSKSNKDICKYDYKIRKGCDKLNIQGSRQHDLLENQSVRNEAAVVRNGNKEAKKVQDNC